MKNIPNWVNKCFKYFAIVTVVFLAGLWLYGNLPNFHFGSGAGWIAYNGGNNNYNNGGGMTNPAVPCLNILCNTTLGPNEKVINPNGYYFYSKVDSGVVTLVGPNGEIDVDSNGVGFVDDFTTTSVRAATESASMRYILCPGPKTDMDQLNCV